MPILILLTTRDNKTIYVNMDLCVKVELMYIKQSDGSDMFYSRLHMMGHGVGLIDVMEKPTDIALRVFEIMEKYSSK